MSEQETKVFASLQDFLAQAKTDARVWIEEHLFDDQPELKRLASKLAE
jgi:hypothetical protein